MYDRGKFDLPPTIAPDVDEVGRHLLRAAEIIEQHGWCQNAHDDGEGRFCALGALWEAIGDGWSSDFAEQCESRLQTSIRMHTDFKGITTFNDHPGRTKSEVIAALKSAAYSKSL